MIRRVLHLFGMAVRETGQAIDRVGCRMQDKFIFEEKISRHRQLMNLYDKFPEVAVESFVAPNAALIGDVKISDRSSVWYNCVLRGDLNAIRVGAYSHIQDRAVITTTKDNPLGIPAIVEIGDYVIVGPGAIIHGGKVGRESHVGAGAIIGEGSVLGEHVIIADGAVIPPGTVVPEGQYWAGNPAAYVRDVTKDEKEHVTSAAEKYHATALAHMEEFLPYGQAYIDLEAIARHAASTKN
eukprot:c7921_g1_i1.p1 GENE.c7921_g1_i1~~c7921_g1_i1.p1  ORF type:complete len:256 (-),score=73.53 c7921_g1_i1:152-868(-)